MASVHFSLYACLLYSPLLTDPRDDDGSFAKNIILFRARLHAFLDPGVTGRSEHKLDNSCTSSGRCLFSSLIRIITFYSQPSNSLLLEAPIELLCTARSNKDYSPHGIPVCEPRKTC